MACISSSAAGSLSKKLYCTIYYYLLYLKWKNFTKNYNLSIITCITIVSELVQKVMSLILL